MKSPSPNLIPRSSSSISCWCLWASVRLSPGGRVTVLYCVGRFWSFAWTSIWRCWTRWRVVDAHSWLKPPWSAEFLFPFNQFCVSNFSITYHLDSHSTSSFHCLVQFLALWLQQLHTKLLTNKLKLGKFVHFFLELFQREFWAVLLVIRQLRDPKLRWQRGRPERNLIFFLTISLQQFLCSTKEDLILFESRGLNLARPVRIELSSTWGYWT